MSSKRLGEISVACLILLLLFSVRVVEAKTVVTIPAGAAVNTSSPGYSPATITVVLGQNNTVIWVNSDTAPHTVTSNSSGVFDSGNLKANQSWSFTFTTAGQYPYHCVYHPWMRGTVIVKSGTVVPEFPAGSLAVILLATFVAVIFAVRRLKHETPAVGILTKIESTSTGVSREPEKDNGSR